MGFMTALSTVTTIISGVSAYKNAQAQNAQAQENMESAREAGSLDLSLIQNQMSQLTSASDLETLERQRQGAKDRAKILASAGEANLSGNSVMRLVASNLLDESRDLGIRKTNLERNYEQSTLNAYKVRNEASTKASYESGKKTNPFLNSLAVGVPKAINTYNMYQQEKLNT